MQAAGTGRAAGRFILLWDISAAVNFLRKKKEAGIM